MFERECPDCGEPVELADGTVRWTCICGLDWPTEEAERRLLSRFQGDELLWTAADALVDDERTALSHEDTANQAIASITQRMDQIVARIERVQARAARPHRPHLARALAAVDGCETAEEAWSALLADGVLPASFGPTAARRFVVEGELEAVPEDIDTCVRIASDVEGVLEAERCVAEFLAMLPEPLPVAWESLAFEPDEHDLMFNAPTVLGTWKKGLFRNKFTAGNDAKCVALGVEMNHLTPNVFVPLERLLLTGYSMSAYPADDKSPPLVVLRMAALDEHS